LTQILIYSNTQILYILTMIGKLRGIIDSIEEDSLLIDVGGVGYQVFCSGNTLRKIPGRGEAVSLAIETHVREDHIHLYGFLEKIELEWFRILTTVQGVGNRVALAILSSLNPEQLMSAIAAQDKSAFKAVSGVGPKLSERIITELKTKVKSFASQPIVITPGKGKQPAPAPHEAVSALVNLGYNRAEAYTVIAKIANQNSDMEVAELIRAGLKELGR